MTPCLLDISERRHCFLKKGKQNEKQTRFKTVRELKCLQEILKVFFFFFAIPGVKCVTQLEKKMYSEKLFDLEVSNIESKK